MEKKNVRFLMQNIFLVPTFGYQLYVPMAAKWIIHPPYKENN